MGSILMIVDLTITSAQGVEFPLSISVGKAYWENMKLEEQQNYVLDEIRRLGNSNENTKTLYS